MRERITENTRVQIPVGTKVRRGHLVYVASGITSSRITQPCGLTSLPTGNRAPSGAVIFSRVECFNLSRHIRRRTDQPVAPHPQADRPTFHYRTCIKHNQKRGTEMADSRGRRHELVEPETCATRRGAQRTSAASNQIPEE